MKKPVVYIDGKEGTTGLQIYDRLSSRNDIELLLIDEDKRKDPLARSEMLNAADAVFLCLPDDAAREAVAMLQNPDTVVLDTSTAHRTESGWCYGFPELSAEREAALKTAKRIAVPGCHASGFIALVYPLIEAGLLSADAKLTCHSVTGYSGGGKKMIAEYQDDGKSVLLDAPRQYGLTQQHKHLKEMKAITGLENQPVFCPIVSDFYSGMMVTVPLFTSDLLRGGIEDIKAVYREKYNTEIVKYVESMGDGAFISAHEKMNKDSMDITVCGNDDRVILVAVYDNLGKGASGAAVECLNYVLGVDPKTGLEI